MYGYWNARYDPIAEIAEPNWLAYCQRHDYALRLYPGAFTDTEDGDRMHDPVKGEIASVCITILVGFSMW